LITWGGAVEWLVQHHCTTPPLIESSRLMHNAPPIPNTKKGQPTLADCPLILLYYFD